MTTPTFRPRVTSTSKTVHVCAAEPIFTLRATTTNFGWTTYHVYVAGTFLFSASGPVHVNGEVSRGKPGETAESVLAAAIKYCDEAPTRKWRTKYERELIATARANVASAK